MRPLLVSSVLIIVALAGCAASPTPAIPSSSGPAGSTAPTAAAVPMDIDGDGLADSVSLKSANGHWRLSVVTASGSSAFTSSDWDELPASEKPEVVGLAGLDPVPGSEVILRDLLANDVVYQVLTWRDGHLVETRNPAGTSNRWAIADEFNVNTGYAFSQKDGQPTLVTYQTDGNISGPVSFVQYAWSSDAWVAQRSWTEEFSADQSSNLCIGLCGVRLTPLPGK